MDETVENVRDDRGQWFVVQTLSGHENKVRDTICRQLRTGDQVPVYEALIPMETVIEIRNGKKVKVNRKFFPGYILVRMDLYNAENVIDEQAWYFVRGIQGVLGFLGGSNRPHPLTEQEFREMIPETSGEDAVPQLLVGVKTGDVVRIKEGAFMGYEGTVQAVDETRCRLTVVISIFGRSTPVDLEFWQVELAV